MTSCNKPGHLDVIEAQRALDTAYERMNAKPWDRERVRAASAAADNLRVARDSHPCECFSCEASR